MNSITRASELDPHARDRNVVYFRELIMPPAQDVARWCASIGWRVLPISPTSKKPILKNWPVLATIDHGVIDQWWSPGGDFPGCKVGIATGVESGIWVLDIDAREANGFATLIDRYGITERPPTFIVRTPSGGEHWYFSYPSDGREIVTRGYVAGQRSRLGPGLDTRGYHGQVLAPYQFSGMGKYAVIRNIWPIPAPRWLEDMVERKHYERSLSALPPGLVINGALGQAALDATAARLAMQCRPGRNQALNDAALALGGLAAYGVLDHDVAWFALRDACQVNGLLDEDGEHQCLATFDSGWNAGLNQELGAS
jgi:Bifunctional DNA primase/polymerase, N-terminal